MGNSWSRRRNEFGDYPANGFAGGVGQGIPAGVFLGIKAREQRKSDKLKQLEDQAKWQRDQIQKDKEFDQRERHHQDSLDMQTRKMNKPKFKNPDIATNIILTTGANLFTKAKEKGWSEETTQKLVDNLAKVHGWIRNEEPTQLVPEEPGMMGFGKKPGFSLFLYHPPESGSIEMNDSEGTA